MSYNTGDFSGELKKIFTGTSKKGIFTDLFVLISIFNR